MYNLGTPAGGTIPREGGSQALPTSSRRARRKSPTTRTPRSCQSRFGLTRSRPSRTGEVLQGKCTGGTVLRLYGWARLSGEACKKMVRRSLTAFKVPYIPRPRRPSLSVGPRLPGRQALHLRQVRTAARTRAAGLRGVDARLGYFRPVQSFNISKKGRGTTSVRCSPERCRMRSELVSAFPPREPLTWAPIPASTGRGDPEGAASLSRRGACQGAGCAQWTPDDLQIAGSCRCRPWTGRGVW